MSSIEVEIRTRLAAYLAGDSTIDDFYGWCISRGWNVDRLEPTAADLAHEIELLLAEFDHGDWTEDELKERLRPFVTHYAFTIGDAVVTGSNAGVMEFQWTGSPQSSRVDIQPLEVSV